MNPEVYRQPTGTGLENTRLAIVDVSFLYAGLPGNVLGHGSEVTHVPEIF